MNELMMPALRPSSFGLRRNNDFRHIAAGREVLRFRSGRLALAEALARSGVGPGCEVLVPAYHCISMVHPVEALGARAVFYRVLPDLSIDMPDVVKKLSRYTKSIIAVHFFGMMSDLSELRGLCDEIGATLVEDCAHCFSYSRRPPRYGGSGDFVFTSTRKFLPIYDGGELFSPIRSLVDDRARPVALKYQLKIAANTLERGWHRRIYSGEKLQRKQGKVSVDADGDPEWQSGSEPQVSSGYADPRFDFANVKCLPSVSSRCLTRLVSLERVERSRVRNFQKLDVASGSFRLVSRDGFPREEIEVPYIFPLVLKENSDLLHARLKQAGVPMWRWEDMRESDCTVSAHYRKSLIQLPCHQELTEAFMDQMIVVLQELLD